MPGSDLALESKDLARASLAVLGPAEAAVVGREEERRTVLPFLTALSVEGHVERPDFSAADLELRLAGTSIEFRCAASGVGAWQVDAPVALAAARIGLVQGGVGVVGRGVATLVVVLARAAVSVRAGAAGAVAACWAWVALVLL